MALFSSFKTVSPTTTAYSVPSRPLVLQPKPQLNLSPLGQSFISAPQGKSIVPTTDVLGYNAGNQSVKVPFSNTILKPLFNRGGEFASADNFLNGTVKWLAELPEETVNTIKDIFTSVIKQQPIQTNATKLRVATPITEVQHVYQSAIDAGQSEAKASALAVTGGTFKFLADFGVLSPIVDASTRLAVQQLPTRFLTKLITSEIPAAEIRASLIGGEGATPEANKFISSLTNPERIELNRVAQLAEQSKTPITAIQGSKPTALGKYAGLESKQFQSFARTAPEQQLPGYMNPSPQAGAINPPREPVGFGDNNIPKDLQPLAEEARKYKSAEDFKKALGNGTMTGNFGEQYGIIDESILPKSTIRPKGGQESVAEIKRFIQGDKTLGEKLAKGMDHKDEILRDFYRRGQLPPIIVEQMGGGKIDIVDGQHRLQALRELGIKDISVVSISDTQQGFVKGTSQLTDFYNKVTKSQAEGQPPAPVSSPASEGLPKGQVPESQSALAPSLEELNQSRKISEPLPTTVAPNNTYVKNEPINVSPKVNDRKTAVSLRAEYAGVKNSQIVRGNQLADEIHALAPKEQQGLFWYKAAKGDVATLKGLLTNPKFADYKKGIEQALTLSPKAKEALAKGEQYYKEAGQTAKDIGTISNIREEYQNRIYKPEPPKDFVKTELVQGLKQTTSHAKGRVFDTEMQAVEAGKKFATTNYADALSIHNEEMARVNTARKLLDTMQEGGLGAWTDKVPLGWEQVGQLRKGTQIFAAPQGIAKGLRAITEPDFTKKIDSIRFIQKYQGLAKSVDLAFSFFHHLTFITQTLSSKKGLTTLAQMITGLGMDSPEFKALELDFVKHTGMTTNVAATQDIMRNLAQGDDYVSKLLQLPIGKQINAGIQASNKFLFEKMQRFLKVMTYQKNVAKWIASHPTATNEAVRTAKVGFAKATNAEFGGLNWQAMGITKSNQSILRTIFLAPDWLTSAGVQTKYAFGDTGTAGQQARMTLVKAILGGIVVTEGINKLLTGHFTDKNPKGHEMEIEVAPNVYTSLIRGAPGELVKLISNLKESGLQGMSRYLEGKLAPIPRTGLGLLSGVNYVGQNIYGSGKKSNPLTKTFGGLLFVLQNASPIPFGLTATTQAISGGKTTPLGVATTISGLGRYSTSNKTSNLFGSFK